MVKNKSLYIKSTSTSWFNWKNLHHKDSRHNQAADKVNQNHKPQATTAQTRTISHQRRALYTQEGTVPLPLSLIGNLPPGAGAPPGVALKGAPAGARAGCPAAATRARGGRRLRSTRSDGSSGREARCDRGVQVSNRLGDGNGLSREQDAEPLQRGDERTAGPRE